MRKIIKIISMVLIAAFIAQDVVWANPKIFETRQSASTLQIPLMTGTLRAGVVKDSIDVKLREMICSMSLAKLKKNGYRLVIEIRGSIKVVVNFSAGDEGKLIADCETQTDPPVRYQFTYDLKEFGNVPIDQMQPSGARVKVIANYTPALEAARANREEIIRQELGNPANWADPKMENGKGCPGIGRQW